MSVDGPRVNSSSSLIMLLSRSTFPHEQWKRLDIPEGVVKAVVEALAAATCFPSAHFIPDDSLVFILRTSGIDWAAEQFMESVEDKLRCGVFSSLQRALDEDWSLGCFASSIGNATSGGD